MSNNVVDLHMRRIAKALTEAFAEEGDDEHDTAVYDAQAEGHLASEDYSDALGNVFAGHQVALGALRYVFEAGGIEELRDVLVELQAAVDAWAEGDAEES